MRKYDARNKRNIAVIGIISILVIIIFSLFIVKVVKAGKVEYIIPKDTIIFDKDKTLIVLDEDGVIKKKWNDKYYLLYQDKQIEIGSYAIGYNQSDGTIYLYGKFYEIGQTEDIEITEEETKIKSSVLTKFYKLSDRKYLVVDKTIKSSDGILDTSEFLIVELDKLGNATLTNHKVNLKTFAPTTIITSTYSFDIANEILTLGQNQIDLKKIIGSTNEYKMENLVPTQEEDNQSSINNSTTGGGANSQIETDSSSNTTTSSSIIENIKKTSLVNIIPNVNSIEINYVVYDPNNEYTSVTAEVKNTNTNEVNIIRLSKTSNSYLINNLSPNTNYELTFKYTYVDNDNISKEEVFDRITTTTKIPELSLKVTKVTGTKIYYSITRFFKFGSLHK